MLNRATQRLGENVHAIQGDIRDVVLPLQSFDIAVGAAVFHHLRNESEWRAVFAGGQRR